MAKGTGHRATIVFTPSDVALVCRTISIMTGIARDSLDFTDLGDVHPISPTTKAGYMNLQGGDVLNPGGGWSFMYDPETDSPGGTNDLAQLYELYEADADVTIKGRGSAVDRVLQLKGHILNYSGIDLANDTPMEASMQWQNNIPVIDVTPP